MESGLTPRGSWEDGQWTSKVGQFEDITHPSLDNLADEVFGEGALHYAPPNAQFLTPELPR